MKVVKELRSENIPAELISGSAVAFFMEKADFVLVGAEGIVQSGGIINKVSF